MSLLSKATQVFVHPKSDAKVDVAKRCLAAALATLPNTIPTEPAAILGILHLAGQHFVEVAPSGAPTALMLSKLEGIMALASTGFGAATTADLTHWLFLAGGEPKKAVASAYLSLYTNYYFAGPDIPLAAMFGSKGSLGAFETIVVPTHTSLLTASDSRKIVEGRSKLLYSEDVVSTVLPAQNTDVEVKFSSAVVLVQREFEKLKNADVVFAEQSWLPTPKFSVARDIPLTVPSNINTAMNCIKVPLLNLSLASEAELPGLWEAASWESKVVFDHFNPEVTKSLPEYAKLVAARKQFYGGLSK